MKLTNEEVQKIVARAEDEYEMLKDKVHEQYDEIQRLNNIINKAIEYIEQQRDRKTHRLDTRLKRVSKILQGVDKE